MTDERNFSSHNKGYEDYIKRGTSWTPLRQLHFMDVVPDPEFKIEGFLTTNLSKVMKLDDFIPTVNLIRSIYIPNWSESETVLLIMACLWAEDNRELLEKGTKIHNAWEQYPDFAQLNYQTISFPLLCGDPSDEKEVQNIPVAFEVGTEAWMNDIHSATLDFHDKVRIRDIYTYGKKIHPTAISTSRLSNQIKDFYWSGGEFQRGEATDTITWGMLMEYRLHLLRRRNFMVESGVAGAK